MDIFTHVMSEFEISIVEVAIIFCDLIGVSVLLITIIKSFLKYLLQHTQVKIILAQGIALSLEFKLGGEVLRTVTVRTWNELAILGAIILLRVAITLLIQWEIRTERAESELKRDK